MSTKSCTSKAKLTAATDVGDLTAGVPPVPIPNTEVKPRRADCTARESVWESRSLPALIKAIFRDECGLFLLCQNGMLGGGVCHGKSRLVELSGSGERSRQSERRLGSERYPHARLCHLREPGSGSEPRQHHGMV